MPAAEKQRSKRHMDAPPECVEAVEKILAALFKDVGKIHDILFARSREDWIVSQATVTRIRNQAGLLEVARPLIHPHRIDVLEALNPTNRSKLPHYVGLSTFFTDPIGTKHVILEPESDV